MKAVFSPATSHAAHHKLLAMGTWPSIAIGRSEVRGSLAAVARDDAAGETGFHVGCRRALAVDRRHLPNQGCETDRTAVNMLEDDRRFLLRRPLMPLAPVCTTSTTTIYVTRARDIGRAVGDSTPVTSPHTCHRPEYVSVPPTSPQPARRRCSRASFHCAGVQGVYCWGRKTHVPGEGVRVAKPGEVSG